jgi:hypothetical protein
MGVVTKSVRVLELKKPLGFLFGRWPPELSLEGQGGSDHDLGLHCGYPVDASKMRLPSRMVFGGAIKP